MLKIAVTGAKGTVGGALLPRISRQHEVTPIDLPYIDILDHETIRRALRGADAVIHLAGIFGRAAEGKENWRSPHQDPINRHLFESTLSAAKDTGVKLFIHASSIHVEDSLGHMLLAPDQLLEARPHTFMTDQYPAMVVQSESRRLY